MSGKHKWYDCVWEWKHVRNGEVIWTDKKRNALVDEGEQSILRAYFLNDNNPPWNVDRFFIRLCNDTILESDTLATIVGEPEAAYGYAAVQINRDASADGWPTIELDSGDWRVVSKVVTFTASGGTIGPVSTAFLATTSDNSGRLIAINGLSLARTILDGDKLEGVLRIKLQ